MDIDEYFDVRRGGLLPAFLARYNHSELAAIQARSAYWSYGSQAFNATKRHPCDLQCRLDYGKRDIRSKLIISPENVRYLTPHRVLAALAGKVPHIAAPH